MLMLIAHRLSWIHIPIMDILRNVNDTVSLYDHTYIYLTMYICIYVLMHVYCIYMHI